MATAPASIGTPLAFLAQIAQAEGDISPLLDEQTLTTLGADVVRDYELDLTDQHDWRETAEKSLKRASQEREELKNAPPYRKSNVNYPILAIAALQFNARAYPAICKQGNVVKIKVIGSDKGRPVLVDGQPVVTLAGQPMALAEAQQAMAQMPPEQQAQPQPMWQIAPGAKQERADRVGQYLDTVIAYRMDGWEEDTDQLLFELPIVGSGFRKLWWERGEQKSAYVSALDLVVPVATRTLDETPRITERLNDVFPFTIKRRMATGEYRTVVLPAGGEDDQEPRLLLESHRWVDLDGDDVDEPYIVTVDKATSQVLSIRANFDVDDIKLGQNGVTAIEKRAYYIKYPFLPHPRGVFYGMGFGHLVEQLGDTINVSINQMFDAGHAQIAGGGFIAAGLRLQGNNRSEVIRFQPGEYKQVSVSGADLRAGIVERTFPQPSQIMFNLLEMMLAAAKDITSVKDILTGDVPNTAPVGTTLAIVEQAQTVFTAIYKRVYRALGQEFALIYDNIGRFGDDETARDYMDVLDDPAADFAKDFAETDMDIKPVADPASVTRQQQMAKAQFLLGLRASGLNDLEIVKRALEAANIEDIASLLPQGPAQPDPLMVAKAYQTKTAGDLNVAKAAQASATATKTATEVGHALGEAEGYAGRVPDVGGSPDNAVGAGGGAGTGGGSAADLGAGIVGSGGV